MTPPLAPYIFPLIKQVWNTWKTRKLNKEFSRFSDPQLCGVFSYGISRLVGSYQRLLIQELFLQAVQFLASQKTFSSYTPDFYEVYLVNLLITGMKRCQLSKETLLKKHDNTFVLKCYIFLTQNLPFLEEGSYLRQDLALTFDTTASQEIK